MKVALVTGANKGIGFQTAKQLTQAGCFVFLACRNESLGQRAVNDLKKEGLTNVEFVQLDVTDINSVPAAYNIIKTKFNHLDILINNAGILGAVPQDASNYPLHEIEKIFNTNFFGVIRVTLQFLKLIVNSDAGRIVNISSPLASLTDHTNPNWEFYRIKPAGYTPSKVALNAYTVMLADALSKSNIRVNAIDPGYTQTDFNNSRGHHSSQHAAEVVVKYALMERECPTGRFIDEHGEKLW